jgi:hypothetical protein
MELFSYILFQSVYCWCIEKLLIFVNWFCILLLCWRCLWCPGGFLIGSFRSSANRDSLTSSFLIWIYFISSSCLIALTMNSKTMLNKSRESEHPSLVHDFRGNGFSFFPLIWCWGAHFFQIIFHQCKCFST